MPGIELSADDGGAFIPVGEDSTGVKIPVVNPKRKARLSFGRLTREPRLSIASMDSLPGRVKPYAVVLVRHPQLALSTRCTEFTVPRDLRSPVKRSARREKPVKLASGYARLDSTELGSIVVALPPNTAVILPFLIGMPKVLAWTGRGTPFVVRPEALKEQRGA